MNKIADFLIDDWKKLPQSFRLLIICGLLLIVNSWLLDHWRPNNQLPFLYFGQDIRQISYTIGFSLILLAILLVVIQKIRHIEGPITSYKEKYSIENIDKTFHLIWFSGKLMLFDNKDNKYYHVYPWETAQDLNFVSFGKHVNDHFPDPQNKIVLIDDKKKVDLTKYSNGGSINTQR